MAERRQSAPDLSGSERTSTTQVKRCIYVFLPYDVIAVAMPAYFARVSAEAHGRQNNHNSSKQ